MQRVLGSLLACLCAVVALAGPIAARSDASTATTRATPRLTATQARYGHRAVRATNAARARNGRRGLHGGACLERYAHAQAVRMARQQRMFHQALRPMMGACHLTWAGENVAFGFPTGRAAVRGWLKSRPHRRNILSRHYGQVAVAAVRGTNGVWYASQVFGRH